MFYPTIDTPQPLLLPENRKLVYPWVGWQLLEDDYREMSELNDMGRTEDIALGLNLFVQRRSREEELRLRSRRNAVSRDRSRWAGSPVARPVLR